eukprot:CAMPEP_0117515100 /NCGR_PEP_ID=MMETSP0784-20121206/30407_1 /TAXON_ID=39447 /ORGANISM="" /LENGTH=435 /DNA_ID=CAMNT_0005310909 /DNA_START=69 /DNA_END=1373 /DNA_ORIENTATION=+
MDEARKLLDSLMGNHRNVDLKEAKARKGQNFKADDVCKFYLLGFCPQHEELFSSTKRDIGRCHKIHSDALRKEFEESTDRERYSADWERSLLRYLEELVRGAEDWAVRERRNIQAVNAQIEEGPNEIAKANINELKEEAAELLKEAEELAEKGNISGSQRKLEQAAKIKEKAGDYEEKARMLRREEVCDLCGSRLEGGSVNHAKYRHQEGKIHTGYVKIRTWCANLQEKRKKREERGGGAWRRSESPKRSRSRARRRDNERDKDAEVARNRQGDTDGNKAKSQHREAAADPDRRAEKDDADKNSGERDSWRHRQPLGADAERRSETKYVEHTTSRERDSGRDQPPPGPDADRRLEGRGMSSGHRSERRGSDGTAAETAKGGAIGGIQVSGTAAGSVATNATEAVMGTGAADGQAIMSEVLTETNGVGAAAITNEA